MTKLYNMDQHREALNMKFTVTFTYGNQNTPHSWLEHCTGISNTFREVSSWSAELTLDKMFEMFIIEGRNKHTLMYIGDNGELVNTIRIVREK